MFLSRNCSLVHKHDEIFHMIDFLKDLLKIVLGAILKVAIFFGVGAGGGAIVCWYYSIPLGFSILGGVLVLGIALAIMSDSIFD
jgi:hypothetical protein